MSNTVNISKTTINMTAKRGMEAYVDSCDELQILMDEDDCEAWILLKPSEDGSVLTVGFCFNEIEDAPACIANNDEAIRNFIKDIEQFRIGA